MFALAAALKEFVQPSQRPSCRFTFDLSFPPLHTSYGTTEELEENPPTRTKYKRLFNLLIRLINTGHSGQNPFDDYMAALRPRPVCSGQPTLISTDQLSMEGSTLRTIVTWARKPTTTDDEIRHAIRSCKISFHRCLILPNQFLPTAIGRQRAGRQDHLRVLTHPPVKIGMCSWPFSCTICRGSTRAMSELDIKTADDINRVNGLVRFLAQWTGSRSASDGHQLALQLRRVPAVAAVNQRSAMARRRV